MSNMNFKQFFVESLKYELTPEDIEEIKRLGSQGYSIPGIYTTMVGTNKQGGHPTVNAIKKVLQQNPDIDYKAGGRELKQDLHNMDNDELMRKRGEWDKPYAGDDAGLEKEFDNAAVQTFKDEMRRQYQNTVSKDQSGGKPLEGERLEQYLDYMVVRDMKNNRDSLIQRVVKTFNHLHKSGRDLKNSMRAEWRKLIDGTPTGKEMLNQFILDVKQDADTMNAHNRSMRSPIVNPYLKQPSTLDKIRGITGSGPDVNGGILKNAASKVGKAVWNNTIGSLLPNDNKWSTNYRQKRNLMPNIDKMTSKNSKPYMGAAKNQDLIPLDDD